MIDQVWAVEPILPGDRGWQVERLVDRRGHVLGLLRVGCRVSADSGSIGGDSSHEFHVLADSGEDAIAYCEADHYAANVELAAASAFAAGVSHRLPSSSRNFWMATFAARESPPLIARTASK